MRRGARRIVALSCEVVSTERYRLLGGHITDISESGMLVHAAQPAQLGEDVLVHLDLHDEFQGELTAAARVARVVYGRRQHDANPALGLRFTRVPRRRLARLLASLKGTPPPVPRRPLRRDYAATIARISQSIRR